MRTEQSKAIDLIRPNFHWEDDLLLALTRRSTAIGCREAYGEEAVRHLIDPDNQVFKMKIPAHGYVYERAGAVLGVSGWIEEDEARARITHCYTAPEAFGKGVGTQILWHALKQAYRAGFTHVGLKATLNAEAFYRRLGFRKVGDYDLPITVGWSVKGPAMEAPKQFDAAIPADLHIIRPAVDGDAEGIISLVDRCFSEYEGVYLDVDGEEPILNTFGSGFEAMGGQSWVIERAGDIQACVGWSPVGEGVELKKLYLDRNLRGQGLANSMLDLVLDAAHRHEAGHVELWSDTKFTRAHRFYEKNGFERTQEMRALNDISNTTEYRFIRQL